jgi:ADP-ribose pyrophosphatase
MNLDERWQIIGSEYLMQSPWYSLRQDQLQLPNGRQITYHVVEHPGYVLVVPLLPDGQVVMERIYRHTLGRVCLECPSGGLDGETPEAAAHRELEEETGYLAGRLEHLGRFESNSGISNIEFDIFVGTELSVGVLRREDTEDIQVELIPFDDLHKMALNGELTNGPSALGVLLAAHHLRYN